MIEADRKFAVAKIEAFQGTKHIATATGFFLQLKNARYFVTNHHVVTDSDPNKVPTHFILNLHADTNDLTKNREVIIPLYDNNNPVWLEHPKHGPDVDAVAIPVEARLFAGLVVRPIPMTSEMPQGVILPLSHDAYVMGYPEGFSDDRHNLPIVRRATIASEYGVPFRGESCFLVDSILHAGCSGSPVFAAAVDTYVLASGALDVTAGPKSYFLGIFSDEWVIDKQPLQLNTVWYTSALREILSQH